MHEKEFIAKTFDRAAPYYNENATLQYDIGKSLIDQCEEFSCETLLDLGSGTGALHPLLRKRAPETNIISLDIAFKMLKNSHGKGTKLCADFDYIPFAPNSFSMVFSNLALQWSMNLPNTLEEIRRVLNKKGKCVFSTLGSSTFHELRQAWATIDELPHCNSFLSETSIKQHLKTAGFSFHFKKEITVLYFNNFLEICQHIKKYGGNRVFFRQRKTYTPRTFYQLSQNYKGFTSHSHLLPLSYEVFYVIAELSS